MEIEYVVPVNKPQHSKTLKWATVSALNVIKCKLKIRFLHNGKSTTTVDEVFDACTLDDKVSETADAISASLCVGEESSELAKRLCHNAFKDMIATAPDQFPETELTQTEIQHQIAILTAEANKLFAQTKQIHWIELASGNAVQRVRSFIYAAMQHRYIDFMTLYRVVLHFLPSDDHRKQSMKTIDDNIMLLCHGEVNQVLHKTLNDLKLEFTMDLAKSVKWTDVLAEGAEFVAKAVWGDNVTVHAANTGAAASAAAAATSYQGFAFTRPV